MGPAGCGVGPAGCGVGPAGWGLRAARPELRAAGWGLRPAGRGVGPAGPGVVSGRPGAASRGLGAQVGGRIDAIQSVQDGIPSGGWVGGLTVVEGDGRPLVLDEEPGWLAERRSDGSADRTSVTGSARPHDRVLRHDDPLGRLAARKGPDLEPMIAQVADAADPDTSRDIARRSTREDRDLEALRPRVGDPRKTPHGAAATGLDPCPHRVTDDRSEGPVEVADDEQSPGRRAERTDACADDGPRVRDRVVARCRVAGGRAQGVISTPGMIARSPRTISSGPRPPTAP